MSAAPDFERYADQKQFNETVAPGWQAAFEEATSRIGKPRGEVVFLDVGCGDGKYFRHLLREGLEAEHIHGVEVSQKRVDRCHDLGWTNARFVEDGVSLPYADRSIDLINFMEVIEHVPADVIPRLLTQMRRVLAPTGYLMVSTPNYPAKRFYDIYNVLAHRMFDRLRDDPTHVTCYNHNRLARLLGTYFGRLEERSFKDGFLYKHLPRPGVRHKIFYLCSEPR